MKKILVAEDEAAIREFIVINLKRSGYEVTEAADGAEAVRLYDEAEGAFDVCLLDIMMPEMDGIEACMHWRRKWQPTPVFLPGESQGQGSLVGCRLWGHTESDTTEVT